MASEELDAAVDTELMALLARHGEYVSVTRIFDTMAQSCNAVSREGGEVTPFGEMVLRRWDRLCRNWR